MKIKKLGTFEEWMKEEKKKLNESNVSIEVDWWDQCIVEVMQDLEEESGGFLDWTVLGDFIKAKFSIIGREWDEYVDNIYVLHIKDLIFQHHGRSFCNDTYNYNAALHTKGVVVEQLAQVIYDKLCAKLGSEMTSNTTKIKVADCVPAPDDDFCGDLYDDLPFESRNVTTYKEFLKKAKGKGVKNKRLSEMYIREEPVREDPKSDKIQRLEEFAHDKGKKAEIIKAWTELKDHPKAENLKSEVGCAFDEEDLDEELAAAFEAIGEDGMIYSSFEGSFWIRHKGKLIRVM